jgi:hypothetical protein
MTLVECVVALAVLAITSSVLVTTCIGVTKMKVTTNALHRRINYEAPIADNYDTSSANIKSSEAKDIKLTIDGNSCTVSGVLYTADGSATDIYGTGIVSVSDHDFKFFK